MAAQRIISADDHMDLHFLPSTVYNFGLEVVEHIGAGNIMWASDYPHGDSTWPDSRKAIDESALARLPDADRRRIPRDNAAKLYAIR
jgi:predicted TIM-barrel fold metal-dependent hydrolase